MSQSNYGPIKGFKAGADLSAKQFFIVKFTAANTVGLASAATDVLLGTLRNKPEQNETAEVHLIGAGGTAKVKLGGSVTAGNFLTADSAGKAVATTTTGNYVLGRALEDGDADDIIEFVPMGHGRYAATA